MRVAVRLPGRRLLALTALGLVASLLGGSRLRATGNLEVVNQAQTAILNRVWHANSIPVVWRFNDPSTATGCNYNSSTAPAATLQPASAAGFDAWQSDPDSKIAFTYGGTTSTRNVGADGINVVTFCSTTAFASGVIARTPTTALTQDTTVTAGGGCPAGQGLVAGLFCFPEGTYPAGTLIDGDIDFNTSNPTTAEQSLSTGDPGLGSNAGLFDVQAIATHEEGHFFGLSHDPIWSAVMYAFIDDNPFSDGQGQRALKRSDLATSGHYYPEASYHSNFGSITGFISLDGVDADGVHVAAINPATMLGVTGRFSISRFEDPAALGAEGPDFAANGGGFYRIDGLPPGDHYVYVEYFDHSDFFSGRLQNRYNITVANSNVVTGSTVPVDQSDDWLGFFPALTEFHNAGEAGNGGDGVNPGTAADNSDAAALVPVVAGATTSGIDIAINIEPVNGQTAANRQNPTTRTVIPNDDLRGTDVITAFLLNGGGDDFYAIRYPASLLPAPPYNVAEGLWVRAGRNTLPYGVRLTLGDPANASNPALNNPIVASAGRVLSGGPGGATDGGDFIDVRDQWNVTINQSQDVWIVMNQPPSPSGISFITQGLFILVTQNPAGPGAARVGRTRVTQNGGATWGTLTADVFYDLLVEADPPVMITGASPASAEEGSTLDVSVNGFGFQNGAGVDFGPNIMVNSVAFLSSQQLRCNITIANTGATTNRAVNVKVTNPGVVFPNVSRVFTVLPFADSDGDGAGNSVDCAPLDPSLKHAATEVQNLTIADLGGSTRVSWDSQDASNGSATSYDVVTGLMDDVQASGSYAQAACASNDLPDSPFADPNPDPPLNGIRYWLARARNGCNVGPGTYGDSTVVPDPRDALDAGSPCP